MSLESVCIASAVVGTILTLIGRRILIMEAASISDGWRWAIRLLPLADIMFLARFWETAKTGAFISLTGLAFLLPLGAKKMYDESHEQPQDYAERGKRMDGDAKNGVYMNLKAELDSRIDARQRKLQQLNAHMGAWYSNMNQRRTALTTATPEDVAAFNAEAAAYQALHQVTKEEATELQEMINRQAKGYNAFTDEDFGRYVAAQEERARQEFLRPQKPQDVTEASELEE